jgi:uncharacterized membrane protein
MEHTRRANGAGPGRKKVMKAIEEFLKTTLVGGFLFLIPLVVVVLLLREAVAFAARALSPIARLVPGEGIVAVTFAQIIAAAAILLLCFVAGLFARVRLGRAVSGSLERAVLRRIPGYTLMKSMTRGIVNMETGSDLTVALARIEDAWMLSFVVERHASGLCTVFVPSAPTPAAGSIYYLTEDRLLPLDVSVAAAVACVTRLGVGSHALLDRAQQLQHLLEGRSGT